MRPKDVIKKKNQDICELKKNNSSECEFDSDGSEKIIKLSPFPKIPNKLCVTNNKRISASKLVLPPPSPNVAQNLSAK